MNRIIKVLMVLAAVTLFIAGAQQGFAAKTFNGVVNLNTASASDLQQVPGIGPSKANAIVEYSTVTPFKTVEEVKEVKGIGDKLFAKIAPYLTLSGEAQSATPGDAKPGSGAKVQK
jgi:comEA protein